MPTVRITPPEGEAFLLELPQGPLSVGRHEDCDVVLAHQQVSRRHAMLTVTGESVTVSDLGSHNGTWVNGMRLYGPRVLGSKDRLQIGRHTLHLVRDEAAVAAEAAAAVENQSAPIVDGSHVGQGEVVKEAFTANPILGRLRELGALSDGDTDPMRTEGPNLDPLALFSHISELLHTARSLEAFLEEILSLACYVAKAEAAAVVLTRDDGALDPVVVRNTGVREKIPISRTVVRAAIDERGAVVSHDATKDERFGDKKSVALMGLRSVLCVPLYRNRDAPGVLYLTREPGGFTREEQMTTAAIAHLAALGLERARLREQMEREEKLRRALSRFHAPEVVDTVISRAAESGDTGAKLEPASATVVFADIVGFTSLAERVGPDRLGEMLNDFYRTMTQVVFDLGGTVDKYIGDCVMALFGVPVHHDDAPMRAVEAAVQMRITFENLRETTWAGEQMDLRIGINTGPLVAGTVGSELRLEYTALGDAVNVAQRLESVADPGQILIGPGTNAAVKDSYYTHPLQEMNVKGRSQPVEVFEVLGRKARHAPPSRRSDTDP